MATEYLDKTGLAYFWSKIKNYIDIHSGADSRLITTDTSALEVGYSSQYDSYNLNIINTSGDAISINNLGDDSGGRRPIITILPDNDWSQAQQVGQLAFVSDLANKSNLITTETKSGTIASISAEGSQTVTISASKSNYTPIGIVGISMSGAGNGYVDVSAFYISGSNAVVQCHNASGSARSNIGVTVTVLYIHS